MHQVFSLFLIRPYRGWNHTYFFCKIVFDYSYSALHPLFPLRETKRGITPIFSREYSATKNLCDKNSRPLQFIEFAKEAVMFLFIGNEIGQDIPCDKQLAVVQRLVGKFK